MDESAVVSGGVGLEQAALSGCVRVDGGAAGGGGAGGWRGELPVEKHAKPLTGRRGRCMR